MRKHICSLQVRVWDLRSATPGGVAKLDVKGRPVASFDPQARHEEAGSLLRFVEITLHAAIIFDSHPRQFPISQIFALIFE